MSDNRPIYVYDTRTQMLQPMFVAYEEEDVTRFLLVKMSADSNSLRVLDDLPDWVYVTRQRLHPYDGNPPVGSKPMNSWPSRRASSRLNTISYNESNAIVKDILKLRKENEELKQKITTLTERK